MENKFKKITNFNYDLFFSFRNLNQIFNLFRITLRIDPASKNPNTFNLPY
jgi:hypothetical protein